MTHIVDTGPDPWELEAEPQEIDEDAISEDVPSYEPERRFSVRSLEQGSYVCIGEEYRKRVLAVAIEADVYIFGAAEILEAEERYVKSGLTIDAQKAVEVRRAVVERSISQIAKAKEAKEIEVAKAARKMGVSPDDAARIRTTLDEELPRYPLLARIASGEQEKIDAEIDRFDRRNEPRGDDRRSTGRPFVPEWKRRELERLERGETAGEDLGVAEDVPHYGIPDAEEIAAAPSLDYAKAYEIRKRAHERLLKLVLRAVVSGRRKPRRVYAFGRDFVGRPRGDDGGARRARRRLAGAPLGWREAAPAEGARVMARLLDLFSGAGGAGHGYALAGFEVVGVDIAAQKRYPYEFVQADALEYLEAYGETFDAIHASPPCQRFSPMTRRHGLERSLEHPDLVEPTRELLERLGRPYVIENVVGAPLVDPIQLCGSAFGLGSTVGDEWRELRRHRIFELNVELRPAPGCSHESARTIGVYGHAGGRSVRDGLSFPGVAHWREAMGIDWMVGDELAEAIPPAYTRWIAERILDPRQKLRAPEQMALEI